MTDIQPASLRAKVPEANTSADKAYVGFWGDVYGSFVNTFKSQGNGVVQLANRAGAQLEEAKPIHVDDPNSSMSAWSASLVGQAGAMAVELFAAQKVGAGLRVVAGKETAAAALTGAESVKSKLYSSTAFGAFMGGVLTPSNDPNHFWQDRAKNMISSTVSIGGMTGISLGLEAQAAKLGSGAAASVLRNGYFHNAVGGVIGGAAGDMTSLALNGQGPSLTADYWKQVGRAGAEFALVGMGIHTFNLAGKSAYDLAQQGRIAVAESQPRQITPDAKVAGVPKKLASEESGAEQLAAQLRRDEMWDESHETAWKSLEEVISNEGWSDKVQQAGRIAMKRAIKEGDFSLMYALADFESGGRKLVTETDLQDPENKAAAVARLMDDLSKGITDRVQESLTFKIGNQRLITADDVTNHQLQHAAAEGYMTILSKGRLSVGELDEVALLEFEGRRLLVDDRAKLARTALARALKEGNSIHGRNIIREANGKDLIVPDDASNSEIRSAALVGLGKRLTDPNPEPLSRNPFVPSPPNLRDFLDLQIGEHRLITGSDLQSDAGRSIIRSAVEELWADSAKRFSDVRHRTALLLNECPSISGDIRSAVRSALIAMIPHNPSMAMKLADLNIHGEFVIGDLNDRLEFYRLAEKHAQSDH